MPFSAKDAYRIRNWAKYNPGLPPEMREWFQLIDETISEGGTGAFPTTTTTTTSSSTTTTTA
jgi:hypothetical protein